MSDTGPWGTMHPMLKKAPEDRTILKRKPNSMTDVEWEWYQNGTIIDPETREPATEERIVELNKQKEAFNSFVRKQMEA